MYRRLHPQSENTMKFDRVTAILMTVALVSLCIAQRL
jgi:hypothetical protein